MSARKLVARFLDVVRSGADPDRAAEFMAPQVLAHQVQSDNPVTIVRAPADYAAHVRDMLADQGPWDFTVDELLADGDKVYARWTQRGRLVEVASCVYRIADGLISEYWIQIDRQALTNQLGRLESGP